MRHRIIAGGLFLVSLALVGIGYMYKFPVSVGWCPPENVYCISSTEYAEYGLPLYIGLRYLPLVFLVLLFVRKEVFETWWKVLAPFFLLLIYVFFKTPGLSHAWIQLTPDRTGMVLIMVNVILVVSAVVIVGKYALLSYGKKSS
jgi:hypothetical protein